MHRAAGGFLVRGKQIVCDPVPLLGVRMHATPGPEAMDDHAVPGSVQPRVFCGFGKVFPRSLEHLAFFRAIFIGFEVERNTLEDMLAPLADFGDLAERLDSSFPDRERRVGDQQIGIEVVANPKAVTRRAHALRAVEAEKLRARSLEADPAIRAGVVRGEQDVGLAFDRKDHRPFSAFESRFDGFRQARSR